jgi:hypothetical protein
MSSRVPFPSAGYSRSGPEDAEDIVIVEQADAESSRRTQITYFIADPVMALDRHDGTREWKRVQYMITHSRDFYK